MSDSLQFFDQAAAADAEFAGCVGLVVVIGFHGILEQADLNVLEIFVHFVARHEWGDLGGTNRRHSILPKIG